VYDGCEFITVLGFNLILRLKFLIVVNYDSCEIIMIMMKRMMIIILP
jgi:hypothetical protein